MPALPSALMVLDRLFDAALKARITPFRYKAFGGRVLKPVGVRLGCPSLLIR